MVEIYMFCKIGAKMKKDYIAKSSGVFVTALGECGEDEGVLTGIEFNER